MMIHPDENWQSLEIAYNLVYHKDVDTIMSWEWYKFYGLRNHLYPFWLSIPARVLKLCYLDTNMLVVNSMYLMHCVLWVFGDVYFFKFANLLAGKQCALITLCISLTS